MHLSWGDVAVDNPQSPRVLRVKLKRSKCDQFGQGLEIFVGQSLAPVCPVASVLAYIDVRGSGSGPFFRFASGLPLTKQKFTSQIRQVLQAIGLPYQDFAGHSFRIGAATAAAKAGLENSVIRTLGRWNSLAFYTYIRTLHEHLAQFSSVIATP